MVTAAAEGLGRRFQRLLVAGFRWLTWLLVEDARVGLFNTRPFGGKKQEKRCSLL
jgi:hypothetical protein